MTAPPSLLLQRHEPSPVEVFHEGGRSPFLIVCDHAGRALPRALGTLGVPPAVLETHIAWDIGAAAVARGLAVALDAPLFLQRYSRLVIDCNRPLDAPDSIPLRSGGVDIPGNHGLSTEEAAGRARAIFEPYHARIERAVRERAHLVLVAMHTFTPVLAGVRRPFHAGVLYGEDARLGASLLGLLRAEPGLIIGDNEPYAASADSDYAIIEYGEKRRMPYVELEVRQDLVSDPEGQAEWAERLARLLRIASAPFHP